MLSDDVRHEALSNVVNWKPEIEVRGDAQDVLIERVLSSMLGIAWGPKAVSMERSFELFLNHHPRFNPIHLVFNCVAMLGIFRASEQLLAKIISD